jgi:hypothetical protein
MALDWFPRHKHRNPATRLLKHVHLLQEHASPVGELVEMICADPAQIVHYGDGQVSAPVNVFVRLAEIFGFSSRYRPTRGAPSRSVGETRPVITEPTCQHRQYFLVLISSLVPEVDLNTVRHGTTWPTT